MLNFVLAEAALELVPKEIRNGPAVVSDSKRRGIPAPEMLLDRSFHHSAMSRLKNAETRGRPDLVHATMLSVTGTPLYLEGKVRLFVHTCSDVVLEVMEKTRIPKNYFRFRGLIEKTLKEGPGDGLIAVRSVGLGEFLRKETRRDLVVGLSVRGRAVEIGELASRVTAAKNPCVVVGGFPHGHFSDKAVEAFDDLVRIDPRPLEAHVVAARVVYEIEKALGRTNH